MRECFDEGVLQSFNDGELPRSEAEQVSLHLTQCASCFSSLRELVDANELMTTALAPEFESAVPTEQLRRRIDAAIAADSRVTAIQPSLVERVQNWLAGLTAGLRQPAFAYGGLAAVVLFAVMMGVTYFRRSPVVEPDQQVASTTPASVVRENQSTTAPQPAPTAEITVPSSKAVPAVAKNSSKTSRRLVVRPQS